MELDPTVYIIDDDQEVLQALTWLLESVGIKVESYESAISFLESFDANKCGCIVTDVRMPMMSGLQLLEQLTLRNNSLPVIFLTGHGDIQMAVQTMKSGAVDFISKPFNDQYLLEQIQKAIALNVEQRKSAPVASVNTGFNDLSKRERQVLDLIVAGKLNKQVAEELNIANSTVEFHRSRVMKKVGAKNLAHLIKLYLGQH